jgi:hypothetical protein
VAAGSVRSSTGGVAAEEDTADREGVAGERAVCLNAGGRGDISVISAGAFELVSFRDMPLCFERGGGGRETRTAPSNRCVGRGEETTVPAGAATGDVRAAAAPRGPITITSGAAAGTAAGAAAAAREALPERPDGLAAAAAGAEAAREPRRRGAGAGVWEYRTTSRRRSVSSTVSAAPAWKSDSSLHNQQKNVSKDPISHAT